MLESTLCQPPRIHRRPPDSIWNRASDVALPAVFTPLTVTVSVVRVEFPMMNSFDAAALKMWFSMWTPVTLT